MSLSPRRSLACTFNAAPAATAATALGGTPRPLKSGQDAGGDYAALTECRQTYRSTEARLNKMRAAGAPRDALAQVASELRALQPTLRALQESQSSSKRRPKPKNAGRASALRRFLLETYGEATLAAGSGVVDIAGGQGALGFELLNLHDVPVTVVDPRHEPGERARARFEWQWSRARARSRRQQQEGSGPAPSSNDSATDADASRSGSSPPCAAVATSPEPRRPVHWPVYWRDTLWRPLAAHFLPFAVLLSSRPLMHTHSFESSLV